MDIVHSKYSANSMCEQSIPPWGGEWSQGRYVRYARKSRRVGCWGFAPFEWIVKPRTLSDHSRPHERSFRVMHSALSSIHERIECSQSRTELRHIWYYEILLKILRNENGIRVKSESALIVNEKWFGVMHAHIGWVPSEKSAAEVNFDILRNDDANNFEKCCRSMRSPMVPKMDVYDQFELSYEQKTKVRQTLATNTQTHRHTDTTIYHLHLLLIN